MRFRQQIYHLYEENRIEAMNEEEFDLEARLQELVADHPELLSGEQMNPDKPRRFILIDREQGIADIVGGGNRWSLDHLMIDQDAIPTLVEAKRRANLESRREIVGQMLDYAAHATQTWNVDDIRKTFEDRVTAKGENPSDILRESLQLSEPDLDSFWQDVETNLRAAKLRLLFVTDSIRDELTRIVEFLNEQMPGIEVLAVEIKQFKGDTGSTLVPRVIGRTSEAVAAPRRRSGQPQSRLLDEETLIASFADEQIQQVTSRLLEVVHSHDAPTPSRSQTAIYVRQRCAAWEEHITLLGVYAPTAGGFEDGRFIFGIRHGGGSFLDRMPRNLRVVLENWLSSFEMDDFAEADTSYSFRGYRVNPEAVAANADLLCDRLDWVLRELSELESSES